MRRFRWLLAAVLAASAALAWPQADTSIVIVHTGDIHGQILPGSGGGGLAGAATLIRSSGADLLLDGGDIFTGTMLSDTFQGRPLIEIMNRLGYDAAALGNHEFDYGIAPLEERIDEARFPFLSANVDGVAGIRPYTVVEVKGSRIGLIGLTVENLRQLTHPKHLSAVTVGSVVDAVEAVLPEVRRESDFAILVAHLTEREQVQVARAFPEIRLIVSAHPHVARTRREGVVTIAETGNDARFVGRIVMTLADGQPVSFEEELLPTDGVRPDPQAMALLEPYMESLGEASAERLGEAAGPLPTSRGGESPLANLVADAMRSASGARIALHNLGGIRANLDGGPITYGEIFEVLPFQNTIVRVRLTGAELRRLLGRGLQAVSGIQAEWDLGRPYPDRLASVRLDDGRPILDGETYNIAVNDFMWAGGDGLAELAAAEDADDTGLLLRDAVADYIRGLGRIEPLRDGRMTVRGD